jgi:hypothetical protein
MLARTHIHEAATNVTLGEGYIAQGRCNEALEALVDAENHLQQAKYAIETKDATLDRFASLQHRIAKLRVFLAAGTAGPADG